MKYGVSSPLRYPGGKSRAVEQILKQVPAAMTEYREPFIGGGSVLLAVLGVFKSRLRRVIINDLNTDLIHFWYAARDNNEALAQAVSDYRQRYASNGRELFQLLADPKHFSTPFERAVRFFIGNRITFSGVTDAGGYSQQAFDSRFTASSIERLRSLSGVLERVEIFNEDYEAILQLPAEGETVFIFLDPPYYTATGSKLYGKRGELHTAFDHERFARVMQDIHHRWLITYDDSPHIRRLFQFARIQEWELQYGMNNINGKNAAKGQELFISNR